LPVNKAALVICDDRAINKNSAWTDSHAIQRAKRPFWEDSSERFTEINHNLRPWDWSPLRCNGEHRSWSSKYWCKA
jgi:hypothetical protein